MIKRFVLPVLVGGILASSLLAKGLEVSPPSFTWQIEALGKKLMMPVPVKVHNHSGRKRSFTLKARTPAQINTKADRGYEAIPNTSWVAFEVKEIEVPPEASRKVMVYLTVPREKDNFGRAWMFYIEVKEKPPRGDNFALACYPKIYVKTKK